MLQTCHRACISAKAEAGSGLGHELRNTRPADILASNWLCGKPAAFDLTVVSPLNPTLSLKRVAQQGQQRLPLSQGSTLPMMPSVPSWGGLVFPLWPSHMELGAAKRCKLFHGSHHTLPQGPTPPSPRLSAACTAALI